MITDSCQVSAEMTVPVGICPRALDGRTVILRRGAIGVVMDVTGASIDREEHRLEDMLKFLFELDGAAQQAHCVMRILRSKLTGNLRAAEARQVILEGLEGTPFFQFREWLRNCDKSVIGQEMVPGGRLTFIAEQWEISNNNGDWMGYHQALHDALEAFLEAGGSVGAEDSYAEAELAPNEDLVIDDTEFAGAPSLHDVYKLLLRRVRGSQRKELIHALMHYKEEGMTNPDFERGMGLQKFLDDAEVQINATSEQTANPMFVSGSHATARWQ